MPDGGTKLPAALAIASEGALTLIGASLNKLVFSTILRSRRRPMQEASAYGATSPSMRGSAKDRNPPTRSRHADQMQRKAPANPRFPHLDELQPAAWKRPFPSPPRPLQK